ncbi:MAG: cytochrome C [Desulfovibrionaceae bacterium]|nr:cytochrome C [Desulfovibrionaceae bacterium]MBF0513293.1 cytochrome C [Desulfovibrionaceae bacterium]
MKRLLVALTGMFCLLAAAAPALAAGPHDMDCKECHSPHEAKADWIIGVAPQPSVITPDGSKMTLGPVDAMCLGCHNEKTGIMPVNLRTTHPVGIKPVHAKVPENLLSAGLLTCGSCHNPHPSNTNYKYLIVDTKGGKAMGVFCAVCHPGQSDPNTVEQAKKAILKADAVNTPLVKVEPKKAAPSSAGSAPAAKPAEAKKP